MVRFRCACRLGARFRCSVGWGRDSGAPQAGGAIPLVPLSALVISGRPVLPLTAPYCPLLPPTYCPSLPSQRRGAPTRSSAERLTMARSAGRRPTRPAPPAGAGSLADTYCPLLTLTDPY